METCKRITSTVRRGGGELYLTSCHLLSLLIHNLDLHVGDQAAHGPDMARPLVDLLHVRDGRHLRHAEALLDADLEPVPDALDEVARQRRRARVDELERREVVLCHGRVLLQRQHDGRWDVEDRDALVLDGAAEGVNLEFGEDDGAGAFYHCPLHDDLQALLMVVSYCSARFLPGCSSA